MLKVHRISSIDWKPSAVVALATSADGSQVAAARADGSLEIWLVSPGSVGWHCQLVRHTIILIFIFVCFSCFSFNCRKKLSFDLKNGWANWFCFYFVGFVCRPYMETLIRELPRWCGVARGREVDRWTDYYVPALMGRFRSGICLIWDKRLIVLTLLEFCIVISVFFFLNRRWFVIISFYKNLRQ